LRLPQAHKVLVLVLTFICYATFHASRKPLSIVKSSLTGGGDATGGALGAWWLDGYQAAYHSGLVARLDVTGARLRRRPCPLASPSLVQLHTHPCSDDW